MDLEEQLITKQLLSDEENDINSINVKSNNCRKPTDSDSDSDETVVNKLSDNFPILQTNTQESCNSYNTSHGTCKNGNPNMAKSVAQCAMNKGPQSISVFKNSSSRKGSNSTGVKKLKRIAIIDSDSSEEELDDMSDVNPQENSKSASVFIFNEKGKIVVESNPESSQENILMQSKLCALCDSESSEDEGSATHEESRSPVHKKNEKNSKSKKPMPRSSVKEPSAKKMTPKEAREQRQEIRSESQRMLRESRVSLPYHKPKAYSIKEFLQRRPRLSLSLPKTADSPPSLAMKMSTEQLEIVTKKLEEREKEVQKFYKSESESEDENVSNETVIAVSEEASSNNEVDENDMIHQLNVTDGEEKMADFDIHNISTTKENERDIQAQPVDAEVTSKPNVSEDGDGVKLTETDTEMSNTVANNEKDSNGDKIMPTSQINRNELEVNQSSTDDLVTAETPSKAITDDSVNKEAKLSASTAEDQENVQEQKQNQSLENSSGSVEYDFNLDDMEDFSEPMVEHKEQNVEQEHLQCLLKKYNVDIGDETQVKSPTERRMSKLELLKQQLGASAPCLSGGPDQEIDLDEGVTKPSGVTQLMERFMQHAVKKNVVKHKVQLDVINLSQGEVRKETVAMSVDPEEEPIAVMEKPGLKLKKLRDELQSHMAQRRSELWQQKQQPQPLSNAGNSETHNDEKSYCGADEDFLDDEEEAELTDIESTEDEDEFEDEAIEVPEKSKTRSAFIDEEAEDNDAEEIESLFQNNCGADKEELNEEQNNMHEEDSNSQIMRTKKTMKRILKGFTEDSDEDEDNQCNLDLPPDIINTSTASTDSWENDEIPPNQPRVDKTPHRETTQSKSDLGSVTPVLHLTALQGLNSGSKFLHESPVSPFFIPSDPSPLKDKNWSSAFQKKLFSGSCEALDSETNMDEITQLCSGKFPSSTLQPIDNSVSGSSESFEPTTQDLISICSGSFPDITGIAKHPEEHSESSLPQTEKSSADKDNMEKTTAECELIHLNLNSGSEVKNLEEDGLISQLLDEEEMEQFKRKFDSPIAAARILNDDVNDSQLSTKGGRLVFDSDEEDEGSEKKGNVKKLHKKLAFSDDESDSELEEETDDEEIDLQDNLSDDLEDSKQADVHRVINYDSEENEIELEEQQGVPQRKLKPSDFVENEAELSESDWDSADEDEKGLDTLEIEQGDADVFDQDQIRTDLEKIHMRRVLDQDNQEIKILQELLLEDGELHGTGRQRQFRWRNIDDVGNEAPGEKNAEIEAYLDEEESEEQWRKARYQREMYLKNNQNKLVNSEGQDLFSSDNSQVLKFGQEAVCRSLSVVSASIDKPKAILASPQIKKPLMLLNTRGSFLARTDKFLTKLAEYTKVTSTSTVIAPKNSKKFVFKTVSTASDANVSETGPSNNKRKAAGGAPSAIKKLRLADNGSPTARNVQNKKQLFSVT